jgi:hypothetical protein
MIRGLGPWAENARKTHCPKGHALTEDNVKRWRNKRQCKICYIEWQRKYWATPGKREYWEAVRRAKRQHERTA